MGWGYPILLFAQLAIAVLLGAVATYLSIVLFDRATQGIDEWEELKQGNVAVGMRGQAAVVGYADTAQRHVVAVGEGVHVQPLPDSEAHLFTPSPTGAAE